MSSLTELAELGRRINAIRLPILMALLAAFLLAMPEQTHEVYRALSQNFARTDERAEAYREIGQSLLGLLALGCVLWLCARRSAAGYQDAIAPGESSQAAAASGLLRWAPRAIGLTPLLAAAYGVAQSRVLSGFDIEGVRSLLQAVFFNQWTREGFSEEAATRAAQTSAGPLITFNEGLFYAAGGLVAIAAAALLLLLVCDRQKLADFLLRTSAWRERWLAAALALLTVLIIAAIVACPVSLPQRIGAIGLICLFHSPQSLALAARNLGQGARHLAHDPHCDVCTAPRSH